MMDLEILMWLAFGVGFAGLCGAFFCLFQLWLTFKKMDKIFQKAEERHDRFQREMEEQAIRLWREGE
jgi:hypothetical protein